ncbi:MAG TPA: hypothetical protein VN417_05070 [Candidatus Cryosericum sp.]|nr:hypothetical protein [Candidatus Cryosericum sp.]
MTAVVTGALAACSMALAYVAPSPAELFDGNAAPTKETQQQTTTNLRSGSASSTNPTKLDRLRARLRGQFLAKPSTVRGVILLPFWAAGKALIALLSLLFTALSPFFQVLLGVLLNGLLLFGLFALVFRLLFPNKRLRDLFTKRNIVLLAAGSLVLAAADAILRAVWDDYRPISVAVKLVLALLVLALLCWRIFGRRKPRPVPAA